MGTPDPRTERTITEDLARRGSDGLWGHPLGLGLVFATTTVWPDHPLIMSALAVLFVAQTLIRGRVILKIRRAEGARTLVLRAWMHALLMAMGVLWGGLAAWSCYVYGFHHPNTLLMLLYHAAIGVSVVEHFVHHQRLGQWFLILLFVPVMIVHGLFPDTQRWGPLFTVSVYLVFLARRLKQQSRAYLLKLEENRTLEVSASHDPLTGLPNRQAMGEDIEREIAKAREAHQAAALLFLDLDGFKAINDTLSHRTGDLFLCAIAGRLAGCGAHNVGRLGGDEFLVLPTCPVSRAAVLALAERVRTAVCVPATIEGADCAVGVSIGIAFYPGDGDGADDLIRAADRAMYAAKRSGKNRICFAGEWKERASDREDVSRLAEALESAPGNAILSPNV